MYQHPAIAAAMAQVQIDQQPEEEDFPRVLDPYDDEAELEEYREQQEEEER